MQDVITYFSTHGADYIQMVLEHLNVSILSLAAAILIAVPLGIACSRSPLLEKISVGVSGILRIIPSLAVLVVCVPILGTGALPAVAALTVLAIPPILINTALGFRSVPADVLEAARGMGMDERSVFFKIKVPLAFPVSFAGVRTAASEVVASATLAAYIGAGGLGQIIFTGLGLMRTDLLVIGGASVAALSLLVGMLLSAIDRRMRPYEFAKQ
ncbi:ABC transporter permease [Collinsella bouchesdurhonensis]|uniref:ABC transporter permease n=1 Tax=Collinsella bouchesdurhonensis TaxID=1907654 RepID=UPI001E409E33|nr:ABC transporter permease [Collinsella bouchesdurhonensis]